MVYAWVKDIITKIMALEVLYNDGYGIHTGNYLGRYSTCTQGPRRFPFNCFASQVYAIWLPGQLKLHNYRISCLNAHSAYSGPEA